MKVYKYTPHINLFLQSSSLKLTPSFQLNDPFETKLTADYISKITNEVAKLSIDKEHVNRIKGDFQNSGKYNGIVSLSRRHCDIKMLSHYASNHSGGILEFTVNDIDNSYNNKTDLFSRRCDKISYKFGEVAYLESRNKKQPISVDYVFSGVCFEKFIDWKDEGEVRYLSDFRRVDHIIIPTKDLVRKYYENIREESFSYDFFDIEFFEDNHRLLYKSYCFDSDSIKISFGKTKKNRSIIGRFFGGDILDYKENEHVIELKLKFINESDFSFDRTMAWKRLIDGGYEFHPMINVNPEKLTGIYLGSRFPDNTIDKNILKKYVNLKGNIKKAQISPNDFSHILTDIEML